MEDRFKRQIDEISLAQRRMGHDECRIAAVRMLKAAGLPNAAVLVGRMKVESLLTADELASRERVP